MTNTMDRRKFIKTTSAAGLGWSVMGGPAAVWGSGSPGRKITVAVMGVNSRGSALARGFARQPDTEVVYICDVDDLAIKKGLEAVKNGGQTAEPKGIRDFRYALQDPSLDAIAIAAPIHWHAPASILALSAGKHVYLEKPCSHNPREGELLLEAAEKYNRVVQMGNQRRSWLGVVEGIEQVKEGAIGRAYYARCWYANNRGSMGRGKPGPVPPNLDYNLWQGPAPRQPYLDNLIHYNWHWKWHWGGGELLNNGTHFIDLARWGLEVDYPLHVVSGGGRYHWQDDQQTPDTHVVTWDYPGNKSIAWESRSCNPRGIEGSSTGVSFHGDAGTLVIDRNGYTLFDNDNKEVRNSSTGKTEIDLTGPGMDLDKDHLADFLNSIRSGEKPVSHIADANISVHNCHLGNIAYRTGRALQCDPANGRIPDDDAAMEFWGRTYESGWEPVI